VDVVVYAGIDLAALPKNQTGMAVFNGRYFCQTAYCDEEILRFIIDAQPSVVAIDAPLTLPRGRCCFDDSCCGTRKIRECDRALIRMGYRVFPPGFSFMKQLTLRGKALRERLESTGFVVIEVHPRTSKRILGIERFDASKNEHESDACAAALTAFLYDRDECIEVGDDEGVIIIPAAYSHHQDTRTPRQSTTRTRRH
jgi:predicted nuclease with RNAse H fold